jgi:hypothetical protein
MTDHDLAEFCNATFNKDDGVSVFHDTESEDTIVCIRASKTLRDWAQDLLVLETEHPTLGRIHEGFLAEALAIAPRIAEACAGRPFTLTGHSRGGSVAVVLGALLKLSGVVPTAIVTFGAPRAGGPKLAAFLNDVEVRQYRCGGDPIPFWPDEPFCPVRPLLQVGHTLLNPLADHAMARYVTEVRDGV